VYILCAIKSKDSKVEIIMRTPEVLFRWREAWGFEKVYNQANDEQV
jgi:hypothetical protein